MTVLDNNLDEVASIITRLVPEIEVRSMGSTTDCYLVNTTTSHIKTLEDLRRSLNDNVSIGTLDWNTVTGWDKECLDCSAAMRKVKAAIDLCWRRAINLEEFEARIDGVLRWKTIHLLSGMLENQHYPTDSEYESEIDDGCEGHIIQYSEGGLSVDHDTKYNYVSSEWWLPISLFTDDAIKGAIEKLFE